MGPGRGHDRDLYARPSRKRLHEDDDGCRTFGADDVEVCSCRDLFRNIRFQMIDDTGINRGTHYFQSDLLRL
jgi:hypothetical protein